MRLEDLQHRRLGRYEIIALLGRGGMAAVYRAHDTVLRRDVALKILYSQYSSDETVIERFKHEAILAARLDHPNIVPIYDVGEAEGITYIAMKLLSGRSLADLLRERHTLPLPEVVRIVTQLASAIDYAHARDIVHRDIKPANVLLEGTAAEPPRVLLTDFGIAKSLIDVVGLTSTSIMIGTPDYMAPELITKQPVQGQTDIYSLGVLLFRCLTGRQPFEGGAEAVLLGHLSGRVPTPSGLAPSLPAAIDAIILKAMAQQPDQRYTTAGELVQALQMVADDKRSAASAELPTAKGTIIPPIARAALQATEVTRSRPTASRSVGLMVIVGLLALLLGVAGTLILTSPRSGQGALAGASTASPTETTYPRVTHTPTKTNSPTTISTLAPPTTAAPVVQVSPTLTTPPKPPPTNRPTAVQAQPIPPTPTSSPSPTPTSSPSPTPTSSPSPTPTSTSTLSPTPCSTDQVGEGFIQLLEDYPEVRDRLGCPKGATIHSSFSTQAFQKGSMIWFEKIDTFYVFVGKGSGYWLRYVGLDIRNLPQQPTETPPPTPGLVPPRGDDGFSLIWSNEPHVREAIGWPTSPIAEGVEGGAWQEFKGGIMLYDPTSRGRGMAVLYRDGSFTRY